MANPPVPVIREATREDADTLSAFARRVFIETFAAQNNPDDLALFLNVAFTPERQRAELDDAHRRYWLLECDGVLAGYVLLHDRSAHEHVPAEHPVEVQRFYVDAPWHGRGFAPMLMAHAVEQARSLGGDVAWLGCWEENPRAIRFYEKQGYAVCGSHVFMVGNDPQRDVIMVRPLK